MLSAALLSPVPNTPLILFGIVCALVVSCLFLLIFLTMLLLSLLLVILRPSARYMLFSFTSL